MFFYLKIIFRYNLIEARDAEINDLINKLRDLGLDLISNIEVNIDYPEYEDIEVMTIEKVKDFFYS